MHRLFVVRHGIAVDHDDPACPPRDADRALTDKGHRKTAAAMRGLVAVEGPPAAIWTSPLVRAQQTAEHLAAAASVDESRITTVPELAYGTDPLELVGLVHDHVRSRPRVEDVALVGHRPHLDLFIAALLAGDDAMPTTLLKKASAALLHLHGRRAQLFALYPPAVLRRLSGG